jgi:hypothetical protein
VTQSTLARIWPRHLQPIPFSVTAETRKTDVREVRECCSREVFNSPAFRLHFIFLFFFFPSFFFLYSQHWLCGVNKVIMKHVHKVSCQFPLTKILFVVIDRATQGEIAIGIASVLQLKVK